MGSIPGSGRSCVTTVGKSLTPACPAPLKLRPYGAIQISILLYIITSLWCQRYPNPRVTESFIGAHPVSHILKLEANSFVLRFSCVQICFLLAIRVDSSSYHLCILVLRRVIDQKNITTPTFQHCRRKPLLIAAADFCGRRMFNNDKRTAEADAMTIFITLLLFLHATSILYICSGKTCSQVHFLSTKIFCVCSNVISDGQTF